MKPLARLMAWHLQLPQRVLEFPWRGTAHMLRHRFREDRLAESASSLTLTTLTALVPFLAVVLSIFTAFPAFARLQGAVQGWMVDNLVPRPIADQVVAGLGNFVSQASKLGAVSTVFFVFTAILLMSSITRQINAIWRVRTPRPLSQSILIYWCALTIGPIALGASLMATSYMISLSHGWVTDTPLGSPAVLQTLIDGVRFLFMAAGITALYRLVPNTQVRITHALAGGLFTAAALSISQRLMGIYLAHMPSYSLIYGTFATLPILLLWIYLSWIIVLLGAVIAAYLPSVLQGLQRHGHGMAWQMQLATELLRHLHHAHQHHPRRGLSVDEMARQLRVDAPHIDQILSELAELRWVGRLDDNTWVLLVPLSTRLEPMIARWLIMRSPQLQPLWEHTLTDMTLADLLAPPEGAAAAEGAKEAKGE